MSWRAFLTDRTQVPGLKPLSLSWDAIGGPQQAVLSLDQEITSFKSMQSWLGSGIEIYDPSDRLAWWGYVDQVSQPVGAARIETSLEDLANRVAVRYRSMEPGKDYGTIAQTDWKDDFASQAIYGVKDLLLKRDVLSEEQALLLRDASLKRMALPAARLLPSTPTRGSRILCRGWFERMRWRQWPAHTDILGHSPVQQGNKSLGASLKQMSLAQSFIFSDPVSLASVAVRIRKIGTPLDQVRFQIQTDAIGEPSGTVRAETVLAASAIPTDSYAWVSVWFAAPCNVAKDERLWLVVTRDAAASSSSYFSLGMDENLGFTEGKLLVLDTSLGTWKTASPDADMLFKLTTLSGSVEVMAQIVETSGCFEGFSCEAAAGLSLPYISETGLNCQSALLHLLSLGTPNLENLLVEVDSKRYLRVYPQPAPGSSAYWLGRDGFVKDQVGKNAASPWRAVGNWLNSETGTACFLENLRLNISDGTFQLRTNNVALQRLFTRLV